MKYTYLILLSLLSGFALAQETYTVKCPYILSPERNIDFVKNNADFWINSAYDAELGGFYSNINRKGEPYKIIGKSGLPYFRKSFIAQSRLAYSFTKAFMLTGDESYLDYAGYALNFLTRYGWDKQYGGWYTFGLRDGALDNNGWWNPNTTKWGFQQHYAMLGIIALYEATHSAEVKEWVDKGMISLERMWDTREGYQGYYDDANLNWSGLKGKGFTPTVDGITTHAELLYLITQSPEQKERLMKLADNIVEKMLIHMDNPSVKLMYPEVYDADWTLNMSTQNNRKGSIGHFIKTAWCLARAYLCDPSKTQYKDAAVHILNQTWNYNKNGVTIWDHVNGAPFNEIYIDSEQYTTKGQDKDYWTVEQGFTGAMINYYITKNPVYLRMADESLDFFMKYFIDKEYGETYETLDAAGSVVKSDTKGSDFKAGYHSNELGYYAYLYSSLYYLNQPVSLYYKFAPQDVAHAISLTPIPMKEGELKIKSVTLDGNDFSSFDASTRTLNIAANQGGKFKVTFEASSSTSLVSVGADEEVTLYPNPTQGVVFLSHLQGAKRIIVTDLYGKTVLNIPNVNSDNLSVDLSAFTAGIYFVSVERDNFPTQVKKLIKR